jgi:short-subunit dehydrogenase
MNPIRSEAHRCLDCRDIRRTSHGPRTLCFSSVVGIPPTPSEEKQDGYSKTWYPLITGASTGIGAIYADRLACRGFDLVLVARNRNRLETLAERLREETGRSVEVVVVVADLSKKADLTSVEDILKTNTNITMLVNNAGFGATAPLLQSDINRMEDMVTLNVTALMRLAYAAGPGFVARGAGTVINIASVVAINPETLNGVYSGTKAFVLAFSESLHQELAKTGVRVQAVLPGATSTEYAQGTSVQNEGSKAVQNGFEKNKPERF